MQGLKLNIQLAQQERCTCLIEGDAAIIPVHNSNSNWTSRFNWSASAVLVEISQYKNPSCTGEVRHLRNLQTPTAQFTFHIGITLHWWLCWQSIKEKQRRLVCVCVRGKSNRKDDLPISSIYSLINASYFTYHQHCLTNPPTISMLNKVAPPIL